MTSLRVKKERTSEVEETMQHRSAGVGVVDVAKTAMSTVIRAFVPVYWLIGRMDDAVLVVAAITAGKKKKAIRNR